MLATVRQSRTHIQRDRVNGFPLRTAIGRIDPISLVVPMQQPGAHEIGNRTAHIRAPRTQDARLNFFILLLSKIARILLSVSLGHWLRSNGCDHHHATTVTIGQQIEATLCAGMAIPDSFEMLFQWIEAHRYFVDTPNGRIGFLFSEAEMKRGWSNSGRPGGTDIELFGEGSANLKYCFKTKN